MSTRSRKRGFLPGKRETVGKKKEGKSQKKRKKNPKILDPQSHSGPRGTLRRSGKKKSSLKSRKRKWESQRAKIDRLQKTARGKNERGSTSFDLDLDHHQPSLKSIRSYFSNVALKKEKKEAQKKRGSTRKREKKERRWYRQKGSSDELQRPGMKTAQQEREITKSLSQTKFTMRGSAGRRQKTKKSKLNTPLSSEQGRTGAARRSRCRRLRCRKAKTERGR